MATIELTTVIDAPVERVFDLARSIDLHTDSTSMTQERAVGGVTTGLIGNGDEVTWSARHFGIRQTLSVRVTAFEPPTFFSDSMVHGIFRSLRHDHMFERANHGTIIRDVFSYEPPLGVLGRVADVMFLKRYMRSFLIERNNVIKMTAESADWVRYIGSGTGSHA